MRTPAPDAAAIYDAMFCRMLTLLSPMTDRKRAWIQASIAAHMATGTRGLHKLAAAVHLGLPRVRTERAAVLATLLRFKDEAAAIDFMDSID